jgi:hypothetical protein
VASHTKEASLLGAIAQVRFVPFAYQWMFDGRAISSNAFAAEAIREAGNHSAMLTIDYAVAYRFDLAAAFISVGKIKSSASLSLLAEAPPVSPAKQVPHLVAGTCAEHPSSYRC